MDVRFEESEHSSHYLNSRKEKTFAKEVAACQGQPGGDSSITSTYHNIVRVEGTHAKEQLQQRYCSSWYQLTKA